MPTNQYKSRVKKAPSLREVLNFQPAVLIPRLFMSIARRGEAVAFPPASSLRAS